MMFTWEQAVVWLRNQSDQQSLVAACYFDDPLLTAAQRFYESEEWQAVRRLISNHPTRALDIGAGRGISSYALAQDGWSVAALEPDNSHLVGSGAIRSLVQQTGLPIVIVEKRAEAMPFEEASFDLVYGRQVLHHANDLGTLCREAARVLRTGGTFIATREHVLSKPEDLAAFLDSHPLHRFYGGEHAYILNSYTSALTAAGLRLEKVLGPFDSAINYFPMTTADWRSACATRLARRTGRRMAQVLTSPHYPLGPWLLSRLGRQLSQLSQAAGRLYSFVATKSAP